MLIPQIVVLIPTYVFLEATLAFLGMGTERYFEPRLRER
jgi:ABC-type dipeptide/oligopeptide/nickel transport system permease subunit